jgi:acyl carrier protein
MASTFETVAGIIAATSDVPLERITPDSHIMKDLEIDSLQFLDVAFEIDRTFNIKIPLEEWMEKINEGAVAAGDNFIVRNLCSNIEKLLVAPAS